MKNPLAEQLKKDYGEKTLIPGERMTGMLASFGPGMTAAHVKLLLEFAARLDELEAPRSAEDEGQEKT